MADQMTVDMIVRAIAEGFDKLSGDVTRLGTDFDKSSKLIVDASGKVKTVSEKTSASLEKAAKSSDQVSEASKRMAFAAEMAKQKQAELQKQLDATASTSTKLATGFGAIAAAGTAVLLPAVQLAARVETLGVVTDVLGHNVGMTTQEVRELEKAISDQGITLQKSRQAIAMMIEADIDLANATDLARLAQDAAVIAGINSSEAFEQVVYAIQTGNIRIARTLGLMVEFEDAYSKWAKANDRTVQSLTAEEKVGIRVNAMLEAGKNITGAYEQAMDTAGKKVTSLDRHLEESRRMLGEMWLPVYADAVDALTNSLKAWEGMDRGVKNSVSGLFGLTIAVSGAEAVVFGLIIAIMKAQAAMAAWNATVLVGGVSAGAFAAAIALPVAALAGLIALMVISNAQYEQSVGNFKAAETAAREAAGGYDEYRRAVEAAAKAEGLRIQGTGVVPVGARVAPESVPQGAILGRNAYLQLGQVREMGAVAAAKAAHAEAEYAKSAEAAALAAKVAAYRARELNVQQQLGVAVTEALAKATQYQAEQQDIAAIAAAGLAAGISGTLQKALEDYGQTMEELKTGEADLTEELEKAKQQYPANAKYIDALRQEQADLNDEVRKATKRYGENSEEVAKLVIQQHNLAERLDVAKSKYGPNSEKVKELTEALEENRLAQQEAAAALAETTAQMIFQQAAAGLDAQAALDLARNMGLLSEQDYAVATALQTLREEYDKNNDGQITAAEGASRYAGEVGKINEAVQLLIAAGMPVTLDNIALMMHKVAEKAGEAELALHGVNKEDVNVDVDYSEVDDAIGRLHDLERNMDDETKNIYVNTIYTTTGNPRQHGGDIRQGQVYWVGEAGAEPFVAPANGYMLSHAEAASIMASASLPGAGSAASIASLPSAGGGGMAGRGGDTYNIIDVGGILIAPPPGTSARATAAETASALARLRFGSGAARHAG